MNLLGKEVSIPETGCSLHAGPFRAVISLSPSLKSLRYEWYLSTLGSTSFAFCHRGPSSTIEFCVRIINTLARRYLDDLDRIREIPEDSLLNDEEKERFSGLFE